MRDGTTSAARRPFIAAVDGVGTAMTCWRGDVRAMKLVALDVARAERAATQATIEALWMTRAVLADDVVMDAVFWAAAVTQVVRPELAAPDRIDGAYRSSKTPPSADFEPYAARYRASLRPLPG